jgi:hypothetical protein
MPERFYGVRHHGPGSARAVVRELTAQQPEILLVEGPPEADALVRWVAADGLEPPVALLGYAVDDPGRAAFWPFAVFSPEWQAIRWAVTNGVPVRFFDLPYAYRVGASGSGGPATAADEGRPVSPGLPDETLAAADPGGQLPATQPGAADEAPAGGPGGLLPRTDPGAADEAPAGCSGPGGSGPGGGGGDSAVPGEMVESASGPPAGTTADHDDIVPVRPVDPIGSWPRRRGTTIPNAGGRTSSSTGVCRCSRRSRRR